MSKASRKLAKQETQRIAAIAKSSGTPLSAADRAAKIAANQYSYQRAAKPTEVRSNANGTKTHRVHPPVNKQVPPGTYIATIGTVTPKANGTVDVSVASLRPFDAFAKLDDVLANIGRNVAVTMAKKYDAPKLKASEKPEQNPASFQHVALIDTYHCKCGSHTKLLTGFARIIPGSFYQDNTERVLPVSYCPDSIIPRYSSIAVDDCATCVLLPRAPLGLSGPPKFVRADTTRYSICFADSVPADVAKEMRPALLAACFGKLHYDKYDAALIVAEGCKPILGINNPVVVRESN